MNAPIGDLLMVENPGVAQDGGIGAIAAAVVRELRRQPPGPVLVRPTGRDALPAGVVLVSGRGRRPERCPVAAAVADDDSAGIVLRYAAAEARTLGVPLRAVHVWTGRDKPYGVRMNRYDRIFDGDRLLSAALYDHLPPDDAEAAERELLHDRDVAGALITLTAYSSLLVVAARSNQAAADPLGDTTRALVGRTVCPLAVLPPAAPGAATAAGW